MYNDLGDDQDAFDEAMRRVSLLISEEAYWLSDPYRNQSYYAFIKIRNHGYKDGINMRHPYSEGSRYQKRNIQIIE